MPYITKEDKIKFAATLEFFKHAVNVYGISDGELNYVITSVALEYLRRHGTSYSILSDVVKALECAKLEFYRRMVASYEDKKMAQNGDVYG